MGSTIYLMISSHILINWNSGIPQRSIIQAINEHCATVIIRILLLSIMLIKVFAGIAK